ncbi:MAG: TonB-dependent receptor [Pseudomonadota bacterium]
MFASRLWVYTALVFTAVTGIATVAAAEIKQRIDIDIPSQPLVNALNELGEKTGLQAVASEQFYEGVQSTAVAGDMTPKEALAGLLEGTGLTFLSLDDDSAAIRDSQTVSQNSRVDAFDLGTLVLRGELIDRDVQESQKSAVVVSGEDLQKRGETDLRDTLARVPGITVNGTRPTIRGIVADTSLGNLTSTSAITTSVDGIRFTDYRNARTLQISTWDMEQAEVLRGPQSTQSGRNALAGAVVLESRNPEFSPEYRFQLGVGSDNTYQGAFVLNTPLIEDQLAVRLSVDKRESDGFNTNETGTSDRAGFEDFLTVRAGLRFDPNERLSFVLSYTDIDDEYGPEFLLSEFYPVRRAPAANVGSLELQSWRLSTDYSINSALTFSSITVFTDAAPNAFTQTATGSISRDRQYETFEQELRLNYDTENLRAVAGLFYTTIDEDSRSVALFTGLGTSSTFENIETENYAVFGEVEYDFAPSWAVIAGFRYDVEEVKNISRGVLAQLSGMILGDQTSVTKNTYEAFLPKLGVVHRFSDDISLGLTYQQGYRAGGTGVTVNPFVTPTPFSFEPEFTDTFEIAFRSRSNDGNRILNANLFYTDWTDQQVVTLRGPGDFVVSNAGSSKLWGAEIDFRMLVTDQLSLLASAAYLQTEYEDYNFRGTQLAGNEFQFAPELMASLGAEYEFGNGLRLSGDINYTGESFSDPQNTPALQNDAAWVTNLNASYAFNNGVQLNAFV